MCYAGKRIITFLGLLSIHHDHQSRMRPNTPRFLALGICLVLCCGCVNTSNWLARPAPFPHFPLDSTQQLDSIRIDVSTRNDILSNFGHPNNRQSHSSEGLHWESFGYSNDESAISPLQFLPLLGSVAHWSRLATQTPSLAISFSSEEKVSGLTLATINAYGDIRFSEISSMPNDSLHFYGKRNPEVSHTSPESTRHGY